MGLFDKKFCDVCGEKISLLGNRKVDDGNLCKDCAKKLSPWFSERRHSTIESIKQQLSYREANQQVAATFRPTRTIGEHYKLFIDDNNRKFTVSKSSNFAEDNPDILDFSQAAGIDLRIDENRRELKRTVDGKQVSYNPPKYEYSYTFKATIFVSGNPYFDDMEFSISNGSVSTGEHNMSQSAVNSGWSVSTNYATDRNMEKYYRCINIGNEMKQAIESMRMQAQPGINSQVGISFEQLGINAQGSSFDQALEATRRANELHNLMETGSPEQVQAYINSQIGSPQPQPSAPQPAPQMSAPTVTCPYCGSVMTPTPDGHCQMCSAPLN